VHALLGDVAALKTLPRVDVAIASEVLEHVADPNSVARALVQCATRFVLVTVPSEPDDNPEHIRLFTVDSLRNVFLQAGATRVNVEAVRGHFFALVTVAGAANARL
jgi:hypothetical protein